MPKRPPDEPVHRRIDVVDVADRPEVGRDQDNRTGCDREDCDNGCRQCAKRYQRYRTFIGLLRLGDDQRAEEYEATQQGTDHKYYKSQVEIGIRRHRHVGGHHHGCIAVGDRKIINHHADHHQCKAQPGDSRCSESASKQRRRTKVEHRYFERDDPEDQHVHAMGSQQLVKKIRRQQMHGRPACQRDQQRRNSTD